MKKFHAQRGNFTSRGSRRSSVSIHAASIAVPGAWWDRRKTGRTGPGSLSGGLAWRGRWDQKIGKHTSELQSLMRISYAVFCLKNKSQNPSHPNDNKTSKP